ncbi:MAG: HAD family hydrolase [Clostridiaceae bacterium]|nr:HAD family hydrolase [Clostridiaceae bacterium]
MLNPLPKTDPDQATLQDGLHLAASKTKSPWRLVLCDLDGTLLDDKNQVSPENQAAVADLARNGVGFTLATGRMDRMTRVYVRQLDIRLPIIACNGAVIRDCATERLISAETLPPEDVIALTGWLRDRKLEYLCYTPDTVYYPPDSCRVGNFLSYNKMAAQQGTETIPLLSLGEVPLDKIAGDLVKILAVLPDQPFIDAMKEYLATHIKSCGVLSMHDAMDIMAPGVSKGRALRRLARILDIPVSSVVAIGDHDNDASMLEAAGLGIAMGNGTVIAKAAGDVQTTANHQSGVAAAIRRNVLCGA